MQRIFISDLHLADTESPQFQTLVRLLEEESERLAALYILGDLCEVWIGDDDDAPFALALRDLLARTSRSTEIALLHGNRDFLIGEQFAGQCGLKLLSDPYLLDQQTLIAHGDQFCLDDEAYQETRRTLRAPDWQTAILARSLEERRALARGMREQSMASNANKPANIMDVNAAEVGRVVRGSGASRLIHGHTHRPGVHAESWGKRFVLGAWEHCGWLLRQYDASEPQLECFPLAHHCEI